MIFHLLSLFLLYQEKIAIVSQHNDSIPITIVPDLLPVEALNIVIINANRNTIIIDL